MVRISGDVIAVAVGDSLHLHYTAREYISSIRGFDKTIGLKLWKQYNFVIKITSSSLLSFVYIKEANKSGAEMQQRDNKKISANFKREFYWTDTAI